MSIPRPWPVRSQIRQAVPCDSLIFGSVSVEEVGYAALPGWRPIDAAPNRTIPNFIASILSIKALIPLRHIVGLAPVSSSPCYSSGQAAPQMSASLLQNALPLGFNDRQLCLGLLDPAAHGNDRGAWPPYPRPFSITLEGA
jgi:hypothetical protein